MPAYVPVTMTDGVTNLNKANMDQLQGGVIAAERSENKGVANGYPPLDATTKIPTAFLPTVTGSIPGEMKMWPGATLPAASYGKWVWADGASYATATYPVAAANIDPVWKTFGGLADPGAGNFRVPDLRGLFAVGMDQMPGGARANRVTRSVAITLAGRTGEEYHTIVIGEVPAHAHGITDPGHAHSVYDPGHNHGFNDPGHLHTMIASGNNQGSIWGLYAGDRNAGTINTSGAGTSAYLTAAGTGIGIYSAGTGITAQNAGGGSSHENMPPTVFVPYIVRLDG